MAGRHPHSTAWPPAIEGELEAPHPVLLEGLNQNLRAGVALFPVGVCTPGHSLTKQLQQPLMLADPPWRC